MKKGRKNIIILSCILILLILILQNAQTVKKDIITATNLWLTQVFPSLFPMFVLSNLLIHYGLPEILANKFGKLFTKIFHTSSYGLFVLIMSFLSGTPSNAFLLKDLTEKQKITAPEASFLLTFTFFSNPLFLLNILHLIFPETQMIYPIIIIHYSTNLLIGFLFRPHFMPPFQPLPRPTKIPKIGSILSSSIKKSLNTLLLILGTICFYYMLPNIIHLPNKSLHILLSGLLELTQGLNQLISLHSSYFIKQMLAISFIAFGGLSIHTQIQSIIEDTNIAYLPFLKGRFFHVIFSLLLLFLYQTIT